MLYDKSQIEYRIFTKKHFDSIPSKANKLNIQKIYSHNIWLDDCWEKNNVHWIWISVCIIYETHISTAHTKIYIKPNAKHKISVNILVLSVFFVVFQKRKEKKIKLKSKIIYSHSTEGQKC